MVHLFYKDPTLSFQFPFAFVFFSIYDKNLHIRCTPWSVFQDGVILSILIMSWKCDFVVKQVNTFFLYLNFFKINFIKMISIPKETTF